MDEAREVDGWSIVACCDATEVFAAAEASLDLVAMPVDTGVVGNGDLAVALGRYHRLGVHDDDLTAERTRVDDAIQSMFDFIEQGVVSPRDIDFTARRADLEPEIALVERQLAATDRNVTPQATRDSAT